MQSDPPRWMTIDEVGEVFGPPGRPRSRASIYRDVEAGRLPPPVKMGNSVLWPEHEIHAACRRLLEERTAGGLSVAQLDALQAEYEGSPDLQAEFASVANYLAYKKAEAVGRCRTVKSPGLVRVRHPSRQ